MREDADEAIAEGAASPPPVRDPQGSRAPRKASGCESFNAVDHQPSWGNSSICARIWSRA